jgi:putative membrane protein
MNILIRLLLVAGALLLVSYLEIGVTIVNLQVAVIAALILSLLNLIVKPIITFFTFPITVITLGLFSFVVNAALFLLAAFWVEGFEVSGFLSALLGSFLVTIVSTIGSKIFT